MNLDDFPFPKVAEWLMEGDVVPFLGAGASRVGVPEEEQLPDARGLAEDLVTQMGPPYEAESSEDLAKIAQVFARTRFDRETLYKHVRRKFYLEQQDASLPPVARLLASISNNRPLFLVTTNYDSAIERAFEKAGRPVCVITQNMRDPRHGSKRVNVVLPDGEHAEPDSSKFLWEDYYNTPDTAFLFKMHGSAERRIGEWDDLVVTEDDYIDFLAKSGGAARLFPPPSLISAYRARPFLFLGYSLQDWNFRVFLRQLRSPRALRGGEPRRDYSIQLEPGKIDTEIWKHRNVSVFDGDLEEFCVRMTRELTGNKVGR